VWVFVLHIAIILVLHLAFSKSPRRVVIVLGIRRKGAGGLFSNTGDKINA